MKTMAHVTAHPVAAEELMAWMDGELGVEDARVVGAHVERCGECTKLVEQLHGVSTSVRGWVIPAVPETVEEVVRAAAVRKASLGARRRSRIPTGLGVQGWRLWGVAGAGGVVGVILLVCVVYGGIYLAEHAPSARQARMMVYAAPEASESRSYRPPPQARLMTSPNSLDAKRDRSERLGQGGVAGVAGMAEGGGGGGAMAAGVAPVAPMIARTASITIRVKDLAAARAALDQILARRGGYSAQMTVSTEENTARNLQASLRVPSEQLAPCLEELRGLGRVQTESQSGEEVTQQHADLVQRLKTLRDVEQRYRSILEQRTGKVSEVLEVEESIAQVRGEIESMEAEQAALEHRVEFAGIELAIIEEHREGLNSGAGFVSIRFQNAAARGWRNLTGSLMGIVLFVIEFGPATLVWVAALGLPLFLIWWRLRVVRARMRRE